MKAYGRVDVEIHSFLTYVLLGGKWSASRPCRFTPGERVRGTHFIGGWVCPRTGLGDVEKRKFLALTGLELRPLKRRARRQSLYLLSYKGIIYRPQIYTLIYNFQSFFCHLEAFDICNIKNSKHIKFVFQFHPYISQQREFPIYISNLYKKIAFKIHN
jgi:hypothetical protein